MAPLAEKLLQEALALPEDARVDLAEALLESVEHEPADEGVEEAWSAEARRRLEEVRSGAVKPVPWEEAEKQIFDPSDARRIVDLHPEATAEGREARRWYRRRSQAVDSQQRASRAAPLLRGACDCPPSSE
jgi:putative addiction module component (TIGR02574 family)